MSEEASQSILTDGGFLIDEAEPNAPMHEDQPDPSLSSEEDERKTEKYAESKRKRHRDVSYAGRSDRSHSRANKRPRRHQETISSLNSKIQKSEESIKKLKAHKEKGTCPVSLRYNVRANITPDEEFKHDIGKLRKEAEQKLLETLTSFHARRIKRNEKLLSEKNTRAHRQDRSQTILNQAENNILATAYKSNVQENVRKLADNIQKQVAKVNAMMQELSEIKNVQNKLNESYP